jgi:NAD(P)H-hydrate epimerase
MAERTDIPFITTDQMREVDRLMIDEFHIGLEQMMENAGRNLARLAVDRFLDGAPADKRVIVLAGSGGNGGGGLVAARRLAGWGARVSIHLTREPSELTGVPAIQLSALSGLDVRIRNGINAADSSAGLIIDAIIGYSLSGPPTGIAADMITFANENPVPVLSLDVPSGLDSTTGEAHHPAMRSDATLTLALPKIGLKTAEARGHIGELYVGDIGIPAALYRAESLQIEIPHIFDADDVVRVWYRVIRITIPRSRRGVYDSCTPSAANTWNG